VIATDQEHARGIARLLHQRHQVSAVVATSDDPAASWRIKSFAEGSAPWIIAVRMVSEGVDIPRLRLGVFATTTTTELFFRQAVGRLVRHTGGSAGAERAWLFIPDDPRLRRWAAGIAEARRHSLAKRTVEEEDPTLEDEAALDEVVEEGDEQLSLFAVLSAQVLDAGDHTSSVFDEGFDGMDDPELDEAFDDGSVPIELPLPPPPGAGRYSMALPEDLGGRTLADVKKELRDANADLVQHLARFTTMSHREINGRLNRLSGVQKITDASVHDLRRRADQAERWLASL
jgi:hypothetical protein